MRDFEYAPYGANSLAILFCNACDARILIQVKRSTKISFSKRFSWESCTLQRSDLTLTEDMFPFQCQLQSLILVSLNGRPLA